MPPPPANSIPMSTKDPSSLIGVVEAAHATARPLAVRAEERRSPLAQEEPFAQGRLLRLDSLLLPSSRQAEHHPALGAERVSVRRHRHPSRCLGDDLFLRSLR